MKRKIYADLEKWKKDGAGKTALLIDGARRVGKSYIAEAFAKAEYKTYILIDFNRADEDVKDLFIHYLNDLDTLFMYLSGYYNVKLHEHESLIIFDEVQLFPKARAAIKYLVADGRYDYMETGSLMSIKKNVRDIVIPSEERHIKMHPMDFEEFLWAMENETLMDIIRKCYEMKKPMGQVMHRKAMDYFRQYMIIGGMPQAVQEYVRTRDFDKVDRIKRDILTLYRADIIKHAEGYEMKVESIFDEIPAQLQKHEKRFKLSSLKKEARFREYEDALFWLDDAMIANICYNSTEPTVGLKLNMDRLTLKCYMGDTGLLISHAFDENGIVSEEIYKKLLFDKLEVNKGMIVENIVAQMLAASGHKLYFYSNPSRDDSESRMEIDFLIARSKISSRHNISPIEVKSGKNYTLTSLRKFTKKYAEQTYIPYVLHTGDLKEEEGIVFLPLYMTPLL
ncbi:MAG: AAA family ATPase [Schaedlerella sp.]|nr:AAA family ATPase [Lachnospiraceae bacterium]MDY4202273.1 AAA family ATPase [Schaedlerella sp.]